VKRYLIPLAVFVVLAGFLAVGLRLDPREVPSPLVDKPAPAFALPRLEAPEVRVPHTDLRGRVWVLNVWASWCLPCLAEHPLVTELARDTGVAVVGLNYKDKAEDATRWLARHGNPYPSDDPRYVPTFDETAARLKAVDVDALGRFQRRHYSAAHGEFAAVGDFDAPALERALAAAFGDWRRPAAGSGEYVRIRHPLVAVVPKRFVIETPDKQNATMRAQLALPVSDTDADYPALMLASYMLGGNGDSRLWKRIRQTEGLSYDVRTGIEWNPYEPNSRFHAGAIFAPQNRQRVEAALADELERARRDGFTQAEIDAARTGLLNLRRFARAQDEVVVGQLELNLELGRRFELSQRVDDALAAATLADVDAALRKYIDPARWSIGWGGDFKDPSGS
jgi:zinc protease